jgi:hypothetical protein
VINRYPGKCACGSWVETGQGVAFRAGEGWSVRCSICEARPAAPEREMNGCIYWPSGEGYTECSIEYEDAVNAKNDAQAALDEVGGFGASLERAPLADGYSDRYEAYCRADAKVQQMLGEGGHLGERVRFDQPDPLCALLGGGHITVAPGGAVGIAEA